MNYVANAGLDGAALALLLLVAAVGLGALFLRRESASLQTLVEQIALGIAGWSYLNIPFAALRAAVPPRWHFAFLALPALAAVIGARHLWRCRDTLRALRPASAFEWFAACILALLLGAGLLAALGPELEPDALSYHLPAAAAWVTQADPFDPQNYPTGYPLLAESFYAWLAQAGRPEAARVAHWLVTTLAVLATALLGRRVADRRTAVIAGVLLAGVPLIVWTSQTANTDGFGILFFTLALLRLDDHLRKGRRVDLLLCGGFLGLAAATKIWNWLFVPLLAAVVCAFWLRLFRSRRTSLFAALRAPALLVIAAGLAYLPWTLRAWRFTGDPLFPLLQGWSADPRVAGFFQFVSAQVRANYGTGHGLGDLLLLGWNLVFSPDRFGHLPVGWLLLPLGTFGLLRVRHYPLLYLMLPVAVVAVAVWFASSQQVRYLAPLLPWAAVLAVVPVREAESTRWRGLGALVVALSLTGWAPLSAISWPDAFQTRVPVDLLTGHATRDAVRELRAYNDEWSLWRFVNHATPAHSTFLVDGGQARRWARRPYTDISYDALAFHAFQAFVDRGEPLDYPVTHLVTTAARAKTLGATLAASFCRTYANGHLEVWQRRQLTGVCAVPPLHAVEPYRWLEVAGPRDAQGYWWIGAHARLLHRCDGGAAALEIVAPFARQGARDLQVRVNDGPPTVFTIDGQQHVTIPCSPGDTIELTAPQTVNPPALGFAGDPTPKAFLVRLSPQPNSEFGFRIAE